MRRLEVYRHTEKAVIALSFLIAANTHCVAEETTKSKPTPKSAVVITNKLDLKKITPGKSLTSNKGASAPIIVDKNATVIKGKRGNVIMTSPKK